jgi:hypothetical protein
MSARDSIGSLRKLSDTYVGGIFSFFKQRPDEWIKAETIAAIFGINDDDKTHARTRAIMQKVKVYAGKKGEVLVSSNKGYALVDDVESIRAYRNNMRARAAAISKHITTCNKALRSRGQRLLAEV